MNLHLKNKFDSRVKVPCVYPLKRVDEATHRYDLIHVGITHRKQSLSYYYRQVAVLSKRNFVDRLLTL